VIGANREHARFVLIMLLKVVLNPSEETGISIVCAQDEGIKKKE